MENVVNFWSFFWLLVWGFVFISYLMVLFQVVVDVFRDRSLSGAARAFWVVALIIVPFLTTVVYLITRAADMNKRQLADAEQSRAAADDYIRSVAGATDPAEQIARAKGLLDSGAISADEFYALKAKALA